MKVIRANTFKTTAWKNGGGITHEIARSDADAKFGWRLSVAEVTRDGAFSLFPDHQRCLVVIEGQGMRLKGQGRALKAEPLVPVAFSGSEVLDGELVDGPCRDFNLMFDPTHFLGAILVQRGEWQFAGPALSHGLLGLYCVAGHVQQNQQPVAETGDFIFLETPQDVARSSSDAVLLVVSLQPVKATPLGD